MNNQKGIILVMALSVMAILLAIAIGFAAFIISDINKAKAIDDSIVAYYAAESGAERTIFLFRQSGKEKIGGFAGDDPTALSATDKSGALANGSEWTIENSTDYEGTVFRQRLYNGQSFKLYFLNRAATQNPGSIVIDWRGISDFTKVQATFTQLNPQLKDSVLVYYTDYSDLVTDLTKCIDFRDVAIGNDVYGSWKSDYVVEIKALGSSDSDYVDTLTVKAHDGICGTPNPTQNLQAITNITLHAVGTYNRSKQEIVVQLPPRDPFSGLLSFVLFSERDITKSY